MTIAIADLAGELDEGLLVIAVGTGLKVLEVILERERPLSPERRAVTTPSGRPASRLRRRARHPWRPAGVHHPPPASQRRPELRGPASNLGGCVLDGASRASSQDEDGRQAVHPSLRRRARARRERAGGGLDRLPRSRWSLDPEAAEVELADDATGTLGRWLSRVDEGAVRGWRPSRGRRRQARSCSRPPALEWRTSSSGSSPAQLCDLRRTPASGAAMGERAPSPEHPPGPLQGCARACDQAAALEAAPEECCRR